MPAGAKPPHDTGVPPDDGLAQYLERIAAQRLGPCRICGGPIQRGTPQIKESRCPDCCRLAYQYGLLSEALADGLQPLVEALEKRQR